MDHQEEENLFARRRGGAERLRWWHPARVSEKFFLAAAGRSEVVFADHVGRKRDTSASPCLCANEKFKPGPAR
jgi:hypothetical protein